MLLTYPFCNSHNKGGEKQEIEAGIRLVWKWNGEHRRNWKMLRREGVLYGSWAVGIRLGILNLLDFFSPLLKLQWPISRQFLIKQHFFIHSLFCTGSVFLLALQHWNNTQLKLRIKQVLLCQNMQDGFKIGETKMHLHLLSFAVQLMLTLPFHKIVNSRS